MKKIIGLLMISIFVFYGCSNGDDQEATSNNTNQEETEQQETDQAESDQAGTEEDSTEDNASEETADDEAANEETEDQTADNSTGGLIAYRPEAGTEKIFVQNDEFEISYQIEAANDSHLQRSISFGDMHELQILNWTSDQISIVFKEENPSDSSDRLDTFEPHQSPEMLLDLNQQGDGESMTAEVTAEDLEVEVPAGVYEGVYEVRKTSTSETTGEKMIFTAYYAPEIGLIKETVEATGENGYQTETVLTEIR